ncbi:MAG: tetratricopeptide repeat protein [Burkholderiales bacterium]
MREPGTQRRLAAIVAADVVGYSRLMQEDDEATLRALTERREIFAHGVSAHRGRIVNAPGDSILAEFSSVVDAVQAAVAIQQAIAQANAALPQSRRMQFRIGVNLGDVLVQDEGIFGDGVNIAARLQALAEPGGINLSASAHEEVRGKVAHCFTDRGEQQVKNIARPVRVYSLDWSAAGKAKRAAPRITRRTAIAFVGVLALAVMAIVVGPQLARRLQAPSDAGPPLIAVLPFANLSGEPQREYFSDGVTEDIVNALGRFSGLRVMAASAMQAYKNRRPTPEQVSRELGVRYIVQGSVRESGGRLRVSVELADPASGTLLWSERYEGQGRELFDIQDQIVRSIAGTLAVKLSALEEQRATLKPPENLQAYDLVLRARERISHQSRSTNREARALLAQALQLSSNYSEAHAALADAEFQRAVFGWIEDPDEALRRAEEAASRALAIGDPGGAARAHAVRGNLYTFIGKYDTALAEVDRAIEINPSDALAHSLRAGTLLWLGRIEESIAASETARRYMPRLRPDGWFNLALAEYLRGRYREAVAACSAALELNSDIVFPQAVRAAALAQLGRDDEAARAAADVRRLDPFFKTELFGERLVNPAHRAAVRQGLAKAGL